MKGLCHNRVPDRLHPCRPCAGYSPRLALVPAVRFPRRPLVVCNAESKQEFNWATFNLDNAAIQYLDGLERGEREDDLVARQLGAPSYAQLTELQEKYVDKIKEKLVERAAQIRAERLNASQNYQAGRSAYEGGDYYAAVELLEAAVRDIGRNSIVGGEAQLWLALAYQAVGREASAIEQFKDLEKAHPNKKIRKQAERLRFIMEAPKLKLGEDERVQIPLIQDAEPPRRRATGRKWSGSTPVAPRSVPKSYLDDLLSMPTPPASTQNRYVVAAWTVLLLGTAVYVNYKHGIGEL